MARDHIRGMKTLGLNLFLFLGLILAAPRGFADVTLPSVIGDNMVLQQGRTTPVWGWAVPGEKVTVSFEGQLRKTTTDEWGRWQVRFRHLKASSVPAALVIQASNRIVLTNILVGEVWLCSGQSNMEKPVGTQRGQKPIPNYREELAESDLPQIRLFKVEKAVAALPEQDVKSSGWYLCNSNSHETLKFSAVGYFFGREIHLKVGVPVGLIESAWGGTRVEPWTPPVGFAKVKTLTDQVVLPTAATDLSNRTPTALYNAMIAPLAPFAIRGALWYQGESNCIDNPDGPIYTDKMEALIKGWRQVWDQGKFPFYYVQLAPYYYYHDRETPRVPYPEALPEMWEAQTRALRVPNTGMIVITDLVENLHDIHPIRKKEVGQRLAQIALANDYGRNDIVSSGPMFKRVRYADGKAEISFAHSDGGLVSRDGKPLTWFAIAGADGEFVTASAVIQGNKVVVSNPAISEPTAVRFAWHEAAQPNLCNKALLPAAPFRTDNQQWQ